LGWHYHNRLFQCQGQSFQTVNGMPLGSTWANLMATQGAYRVDARFLVNLLRTDVPLALVLGQVVTPWPAKSKHGDHICGLPSTVHAGTRAKTLDKRATCARNEIETCCHRDLPETMLISASHVSDLCLGRPTTCYCWERERASESSS
jgi:hypothetical protein